MKIRIQRKRTWLATETKQLFALGNLCTNVLESLAAYGGGDPQKSVLLSVQIENRAADTRLKAERESKLIAENQRLELLNAKLRLELEDKFGRGKVARALGEQVPAGEEEFENLPHTV